MRRRTKYDIYIVITLAIITVSYFVYNHISAESRGVKAYAIALESYKSFKYEEAYQKFKRVPSESSLKESALFRQARCATNLGKKDIAIKKYKKIVHSGSKTSIVPISEYNMATLMLEQKNNKAKKHFKRIIKKYPTSDYAIASNYYLGLIEINKLPKSEKRKEKSKRRALGFFEEYISKAPDGRFAINTVNEIDKLNLKLTNYDNLLIAKTYYANGEYEKAKKYLSKTTLSESWVDFAKNEYRLNNFDKTRYYVEFGLKNHSETVDQDDVFEIIDNYIATFPQKKEGINALIAKKYSGNGADYINYLNCKELYSGNEQAACYVKMYEKYPNGHFSAEVLSNIFLNKYLQKKYFEAQRVGLLYLRKFPEAKSSPEVTYFMGKIAFKLKHYESANNYFKQVIAKYPDSYYAYRAHCNIYKEEGSFPYVNIEQKSVVFPYKKSLDKNLVIKLAFLKDYDLVDELCKKDKFIQSWIAYEKKDYTISVVLARQAMEEMDKKPPFDDLRWRLIYPLHYYDIVQKVNKFNNPIVIESIIKEESHFNPYAGSGVGAKGLMQLMPATYSEIVSSQGMLNDIYSPQNNIKAGSIYYANLKKVLGNKDLYAISAYNGGIGSVTSWFSKIVYNDTDEFVEQIPYPETKNYVKKVLRTYWTYSNIYQ